MLLAPGWAASDRLQATRNPCGAVSARSEPPNRPGGMEERLPGSDSGVVACGFMAPAHRILWIGIVLSAYIVWKCDDGVSIWSGCCWLVDYQFGFVRRGLPGACLPSADGVLPLVGSVARVQLWTLAAAVLLSLYRVFQAARQAEPGRVAYLPAWLGLFLLAPFTLAQFAEESGRFDLMLHLVALPVLVWVVTGSPWRWLALPAGGLLIVIHELALFVHLPALVVLWAALAQRRGESPRGPWLLALVAGLGTAVVLWFGGIEGEPDRFAAYLRQRAGGEPLPAGLIEYYQGGLRETMQGTWAHLRWATLRHLLLLAVVGMPLWILTGKVWAELLRGESRLARWLPAVGLCALPLFVLGCDYQRWIGNVLLAQWALQLAFAHATGRWPVFGTVVSRHPRWFLAAILACLALGPIGVGSTMGSRFCLLRPMGS